MGVFGDFVWREMVQDHTEGLDQLLEEQEVHAYIGFDPSADSLHVGSLVPLLSLARLQKAGHHSIALIGGATGMIGDPSGKSKERNLLNEDELAKNVEGIRAQISRFLDFEREGNPAQLVNNLDWLGSFRMLDFLRDVGKNFTVNAMMAKESVKRRLGSEAGISYTEFSYLVLQSYDFLELHDRHGVMLQLGGSDQWGNITAGIDLIRSKRGARAHGITWPLIVDSSGEKFGKTAEGAIWLDPGRTSPYRFYQYWLNTTDTDVIRYLKIFTFLSQDEIEGLEKEHQKSPETRGAQQRLAEEVTRIVHGDDELSRAQRATRVFFGSDLKDVGLDDILEVFADVPAASASRSLFEGDGVLVVEALADTGIVKSKGEARRSIDGGGVNVNNQRVGSTDARLRLGDAVGESVFVVRLGKKKYHLIRIED